MSEAKSTSPIPPGAIEPIPKYVLSMSPEGWARQAGTLKPEANGKNIHWTTDPTVELPIKISTDPKSPMSRPPKTVMEVFDKTVSLYPNEPALRVKRGGEWQTLTWSGYRDAARAFAKACINAGHQRHEGVCIIGFNSPEWIVANVGAIFAGGLASGIYTTNSAEASTSKYIFCIDFRDLLWRGTISSVIFCFHSSSAYFLTYFCTSSSPSPFFIPTF